MCCTCHFWSCSLCSFGFCLLVSSVSNFHPDTGRQHGLLFRFVCSAVLQAGRGAADKCSLACVGSTCSIPATLGFPPLAACVLSLSTMLRLQAALQGACPELCVVPVFGYSKRADSVGPAFCAFPSLSSLDGESTDTHEWGKPSVARTRWVLPTHSGICLQRPAHP